MSIIIELATYCTNTFILFLMITMNFLSKKFLISVHGRAVPETGRVSIVEHKESVLREFVWEPVAAGDWTFLGGSAFDSGFRHNLVDIKQIRKPKQESAGLRYIVIQETDQFSERTSQKFLIIIFILVL